MVKEPRAAAAAWLSTLSGGMVEYTRTTLSGTNAAKGEQCAKAKPSVPRALR